MLRHFIAMEAQLAQLYQVKEFETKRLDAADPDYVESASEGMENELLDNQVAPASQSISRCVILLSSAKKPADSYNRSSQAPLKAPLAKGVVKKGPRATIRIMYDYGVSEKTIATKFNRSVDYIRRVITNDARTPDALDEDYDYVDEETKTDYPPRASLIVHGKPSAEN